VAVSACPPRGADATSRCTCKRLGNAYLLSKRTCENVLESELDVAGVQGRRLDEGKVVVA